MKPFFALCLAAALSAACSKSTAPAAEPVVPSNQPAAAAEPAAPADEPVTAVAPAPAGSDAEMEAHGMALMDELVAIMDETQTDCDQMAVRLNGFFDVHTQEMIQIKAWSDKQTQEQKKAFEERHRDDMQAMQQKMVPAIMACKDHDGVRKAFERMPH